MNLISVVIPVYNEEKVIEELTERLVTIFNKQHEYRYEIIFINDGSKDNSTQILDQAASKNPSVKVLHLSRNFGHQPALHAGISYSAGDAVIIMDADLQDNPEAIPSFLSKWKEGYDIVYATRTDRKEHIFKRVCFTTFYRVLNFISYIPIPLDAGNFGLIARVVADEISSIQDHDRFFPGLRAWTGFKQIGVDVERGKRYDENPRVSFYGLWMLAKTAIFSFSSLPLSIFYLIALLSILVFFGLCFFTLYHKLITGLAIPGWTSYLMVTSFFGAINALGIGILGEYVLRIYNQVRKYPIYIIQRKINFTDKK